LKEIDITPFESQTSDYLREALFAVARNAGATPETTFEELPEKARDAFFYGSSEKISFKYGNYEYKTTWKGATPFLKQRYEESNSENLRQSLEDLISPVLCHGCNGKRLQPESLAVRVADYSISDLTALSIDNANKIFDQVKLNPREEKIAGLILREIRS